MSQAVNKALARITNPELRMEVNSILLKLQALPEGATASLEPSVKQGKAEDSPPKGVGKEAADGTPSPDVSLWAHYAFRFGRAALTNNEVEIRRLLIEATREYEDFTEGIDEDRLMIERRRDEIKDTQLVLEHGEGIHAAILATRHHWPIGWVKVVRERNGLEPVYGHSRPKWREASTEARYCWVQECKEQGLSQRETAMRLGISHGSVGNYWHEERAA